VGRRDSEVRQRGGLDRRPLGLTVGGAEPHAENQAEYTPDLRAVLGGLASGSRITGPHRWATRVPRRLDTARTLGTRSCAPAHWCALLSYRGGLSSPSRAPVATPRWNY
jgi:hypothetical protein